jgi:hypothetical protein
MSVEHCIVDNTVFLLGLDSLYRDAMKGHERGELLACARELAEVLDVAPAAVPIEGYYGEEPELALYFRLMRALQDVGPERQSEVAPLTPFLRLHEVAAAPLYGRARDVGKLFPVGRDPLSQALEDGGPAWSVARLTSAAGACARAWDDFSLVGLAARSGNAVVLTALRESVVLYGEVVFAALARKRYEYIWRVDSDLAAQANRFIAEFNRLFGNELPPAEAAQAKIYWAASDLPACVGRCVRLASDDTTSPVRHYHWAIREGQDGDLTVHEFWDTEIWTTDRYRRNRMRDLLHGAISGSA